MPASARSKARDVELDPQATRVLRKFRVLFNTVRKHFRTTENQVGLSGAQVWALGIVHDRPGLGVNELAAAMDVHQSTASNLLRSLTAHGMVKTKRDEADGRAVRLSATAKGLRALKSAPGPYAGVLPEALVELDSATLKRLDRDLARLIAIISPEEDAERIPLGHKQR